MSDLKSLKRQLRQQMQALLQEKAASLDPAAALRAGDLFLQHFAAIDPKTKIAATLPLALELDPTPLIEVLDGKGFTVCLPVVVEKGAPLLFRQYRTGDALEEKAWGLREPLASAPEIAPDLLLCPLLAFDRAGGRLGRGAGYFDVTLRSLRKSRSILAVGFAHALQEVKQVPMGNIDEGLDVIITEREVILPPARQPQA